MLATKLRTATNYILLSCAFIFPLLCMEVFDMLCIPP